MNDDTQQVNENYKFRMAYVISFIKDIFATSKEIKETELGNKIRTVEQNEDTKYIEALEKDINTHEIEKTKKKTAKKSQTNKNIIEIEIKENALEEIDSELDKDEDNDLYR